MITVNQLTKTFDGAVALNQLTCTIPSGCIYGLVGSNGAGKSTLLRLINGIYQADGGEVLLDGVPVYDNAQVKAQFVFVSDELTFLPQATLARMNDFYAHTYPAYDRNRFEQLRELFALDAKKNLNTFSKGMKRQAALCLALSTRARYLFIDETFDGLDPVMRNLVKNILYADIEERQATAVITSHSLRELEDTCDQLALLHEGGILFQSEVENLKTSLHKVQIAFEDGFDRTRFASLPVVAYHQLGSVASLILRGDRAENTRSLQAMNPLLMEVLPLSLEEVFVYEMQAMGYAPSALEL